MDLKETDNILTLTQKSPPFLKCAPQQTKRLSNLTHHF